jgi:hypothetical protein
MYSRKWRPVALQNNTVPVALVLRRDSRDILVFLESSSYSGLYIGSQNIARTRREGMQNGILYTDALTIKWEDLRGGPKRCADLDSFFFTLTRSWIRLFDCSHYLQKSIFTYPDFRFLTVEEHLSSSKTCKFPFLITKIHLFSGVFSKKI